MPIDDILPIFSLDNPLWATAVQQAIRHAAFRRRSVAAVSFEVQCPEDEFGGSARSALEETLAHAARRDDLLATDARRKYYLLYSYMKESSDLAVVIGRLWKTLSQRDNLPPVALGIAMFTYNGSNESADVLRLADDALEEAKRHQQPVYLSSSINDPKIHQQVGIALYLQQALANRAFDVYFQPKLDLASGKICGNEALVRMRKNGSVVPPLDFIRLAERLEFMTQIGDYILEEACRQTAELRRYAADIAVSVNVSPYQLGGEPTAVAERFTSIIRNAGLQPQDVTIELTETSSSSITPEGHIDHLRGYCDALYTAGIAGVSVDDAFTGSNTYKLLTSLPFTELKLDRSHILDLEYGTDAFVFAQSIVAMTHFLSMVNGRRRVVVAEGVPSEKLELVRKIGCDHAQSFDICRPLPFAEYVAFVERRPDLFSRINHLS